MSYQIYYDRAFIRVGEFYIPLVNSGSNNCFEYSGKREIPEKNWSVLNWNRRNRVMFSADEIRAIAREHDEYNQESGIIHKSRYRVFEAGEFERWVINGLKSAYTVEEYRSFGNGMYVTDYSAQATKDWTEHRFKTTEELLATLDQLSGAEMLTVSFAYNRGVDRPVNNRPRGRGLRASDLTEYFILGGVGSYGAIKGRTVYLVKLRRRGIEYLTEKNSPFLKVFRSEREAQSYLTKYESRLMGLATFAPALILKTTAPAGGVA